MITGGNAGLGKATALALAGRDAKVVIVSRSRKRGEAALAEMRRESGRDDIDLLVADLSSQRQVRRLAADFKQKYERLHVLVNNAGVIPRARQITEDGLEMQFAVNHLAYFLLTAELLDMLQAGAPARIVNVSSMVHAWATLDFDDLQNERHYSPTGVYAQTKLMNVLFTYELARRLAGTAVSVNCLHPGVIPTNLNAAYMGRRRGTATPEQLRRGAQTTVYLASSPEVEGVTGKYFVDQRARRSAAVSYDEAIAGRLWRISEQYVSAGTGDL